ncbi:MAG: S8 family peptidase [Candidatus Pacearchaeota archaeon]
MFATEEALFEFENRLSSYIKDGKVTRKEFIQATLSIDLWKKEDRIGKVLKKEGIPQSDKFLLDVELWNLENEERSQMIAQFEKFLKEKNIKSLDEVKKNYITIYRVECSKQNYEFLLNYRDVKVVDLPPRFTLEYSLLQTNINEILTPKPPPQDAPSIAIIDSGINSNHPLLKTCIGDTRSYLNDNNTNDSSNHGTAVSGIVVYGDVEAALKSKSFEQEFFILSARVLDQSNQYNPILIENQIERAVKEFYKEYNCKIFNLSLGDSSRPYEGGRVGSFTTVIDNLAHELGVLFIISAGNLSEQDIRYKLSKGKKYPNYLLEDSNILEPANSINALTVGSIAKYEKSRESARNEKDPSYQAIARSKFISPFSRIGFGVGGSIKPEVVLLLQRYVKEEQHKSLLGYLQGQEFLIFILLLREMIFHGARKFLNKKKNIQ